MQISCFNPLHLGEGPATGPGDGGRGGAAPVEFQSPSSRGRSCDLAVRSRSSHHGRQGFNPLHLGEGPATRRRSSGPWPCTTTCFNPLHLGEGPATMARKKRRGCAAKFQSPSSRGRSCDGRDSRRSRRRLMRFNPLHLGEGPATDSGAPSGLQQAIGFQSPSSRGRSCDFPNVSNHRS